MQAVMGGQAGRGLDELRTGVRRLAELAGPQIAENGEEERRGANIGIGQLGKNREQFIHHGAGRAIVPGRPGEMGESSQ